MLAGVKPEDPPIKVSEGKGDARDHAARECNVSPAYVDRAEDLMDNRPELAAKVESGEMKFSDALRERKRERRIEKLNSELAKGLRRIITLG